MEAQQQEKPRRLGRCGSCGLAVVVDERDEVIRACEHVDAPVVVDISGAARGQGAARG